ncbi:hypothetical protein [Apilactobacillus ozensis]|uniref:hypothetical protein n=1 Tax=Apilactobacillus ozensis TaxID=866801 RepID=UPI002009E765|nr:hypothetical protein [Apilactobacillus ozensis]MCK8607798.1 hypothetical protein [Apilactobacillus ozensis]
MKNIDLKEVGTHGRHLVTATYFGIKESKSYKNKHKFYLNNLIMLSNITLENQKMPFLKKYNKLNYGKTFQSLGNLEKGTKIQFKCTIETYKAPTKKDKKKVRFRISRPSKPVIIK